MAIVQKVKVGYPFFIQLDSNASTGYKWEIKYYDAAISLIKQTYSTKQPILPGKPGKTIFKLLIKKKGEYIVDFILKRPWEKHEKAIRTVEYFLRAN